MYQKYNQLILEELRQAFAVVDENEVEALAKAILQADTVFLTGVGRVLLALQAFCKRLNHLGIAAYCVGELNEPAATSKSLLIVGSGSGESVCPAAIVKKAAALGLSIAHIGSNAHSSMEPYSHIFVRIPVQTKLGLPDEISSRQPMSSLFEQAVFLLGDTVSLMLAEMKQEDVSSLWQYHANLE